MLIKNAPPGDPWISLCSNLNHVSMLSRVWWNISLDRGPRFPGYREDWRRGTCEDPQRTKGHSWVPKLTLENVLLDQDQP